MRFEEGKVAERKNVLVGIRIDGHSRELLNWALVKVADPGDRVVAVHVCRDSDSTSKGKPLLDDYLGVYEGLCNSKQVDLTGQVLKGSSIRKVLVREAKNRAAMTVIVGIGKLSPLGGWASIAKYCAKRLPPTTEVLAIHNGKVIFRRCSNNQLAGLEGDPKRSLYPVGSPILKDYHSEFGDSEMSEDARHSHAVVLSFEDGSRESSVGSKDDKRLALLSISPFTEDLAEQKPGWPLLRTATTPMIPPSLEARNMSVVKWVMSLPNRSFPETALSEASFSSSKTECPLGRASSNFAGKIEGNRSPKRDELQESLELLLKTNSSGCKWFRHDILKTSTSQFSSENLIGKGGCNCVYKGLLPGRKPVAVKILKSSKEAWKDFTLEVNIMTSLKHKNITPLLGISVEDKDLISVYDLLPKGNLEENLHGNKKEKSPLSLELRFNIAVGIADALNYLHNECCRPIIHRDVKSSNILLSDDFKPQLSDFGLAIWGPTTSSFLTHSDVVGTFGYLAPEYFMYGKVSDKIDVYSFGVVLLELLSGRKPINSQTPNGQESLIMWAKPKLERGDLGSILDPNLDNDISDVQIQRMALAATLCLTRAARLRPKMNQILKILRGEKGVDERVNFKFGDKENSENEESNDDEVYPDSSAESHLGIALLDMDGNSTSFSSMGQSGRHSLEDYFKGRWSRSSSLD